MADTELSTSDRFIFGHYILRQQIKQPDFLFISTDMSSLSTSDAWGSS